ncbi:protein CHROMATIN REMODELING 19 [Amaranthus tricolor]|uniref:protein CHROMATIN REMODELING 19 n=1 Tax=Amaranthus tricolor TaxID=29722 RepID=UPI00258914BF|nr:protein CHROMATIN REMODELING 19 [Amaranthus tricolor]
MKRTFDEISDEEWEKHKFKPSKVLNSTSSSSSTKPTIESFSFKNSRSTPIDLTDDGDEDYVPPSEGEDDLEHHDDVLEDDDADLVTSRTSSRGRRFIVDDDEEDEYEELQEVVEVKSDIEEEEEMEMFDLTDDDDDEDEEEFLEKEEEDVVGKALQKCGKISAELRKELSMTATDRYSEVDSSSVRIVTQDDINAAHGADNSDFQPFLKPYQLVGVNFLLLLNHKKIGGAILADEMGLGKTVQAITYLMLLNHLQNDPGPHLIVCPASVLENWERELAKWCPTFSVLQFHGAGRAAYAKELSSLAKSGLPPPFNVLLVCYSLFERHSAQQKDDRKILKRWRWSCVLMDEAHALKDKNSYRWKNLMTVAKNAKQRLMLTGTPLQNDLHELWSMLEFMLPDLFATEDVDLKKLLSSDDYELIARMKSILGPFILRRLKSDVMQQLVQKEQRVQIVCMGKEHDDAYKEAIEEYRAVSLARAPKSNGLDSNTVMQVLPRRQLSNYFVQFRKIANHPLLVRRIYKDADIVRFAKKLYPMGVFGHECTLDRVIDEMKGYSDFSIHRLLYNYGIKGILRDKQVVMSAKCQELTRLLPSLKRDGHRVLIFSQWTSMLDILEWALDVIGVTYTRLDGSTQVTERQTIVDTFNNDTSIFACLLSTRAGGQGLNLTGADTVIIHDMDFNPQIDRQAEDRCHRIGQTKPVTIYRLVTKDTVDENVYQIAKRKLVLDAAVLESDTVVVDNGEMPEKTMGEILFAILQENI